MNTRQTEVLQAAIASANLSDAENKKAFGRLCFVAAADAVFEGDISFIKEIASNVKKLTLGKYFMPAMRLLLGDASETTTRKRGNCEIPCRLFVLPEAGNFVEVRRGREKTFQILDKDIAKSELTRARQEAKSCQSRGHWIVETIDLAKHEKEEKRTTLPQIRDKVKTLRQQALDLPEHHRARVLQALAECQAILDNME